MNALNLKPLLAAPTARSATPMSLLPVGALALAMIASDPAYPQSCTPAALQRDGSSGARVVRLAGDYALREQGRQTVALKAGQAYWLAASGCPRTRNIEMVLKAPDGTVVLRRVGHTTGACVKVPADGTYELVVSPLSLASGYDWGSIAAEGKQSDCVVPG